MIVALDNTFLTLVLNPKAPPRPNPQTGQPVTHWRPRIEALIDNLSKRGHLVVIPAPAFAEALCASPDVERILAQIERSTALEVRPFDVRAAIELADMTRKAVANGDKRDGVDSDWQHVKFDRQIVSIAKAHGASILFTDDSNQTKFAGLAGLKVQHTWELPLPDEYSQIDWVRDEKIRPP